MTKSPDESNTPIATFLLNRTCNAQSMGIGNDRSTASVKTLRTAPT
jgi:hypothetical protein